MFTHDQIKEVAKARAETEFFSGIDKMFLDGMIEGFVDGAIWADRQLDAKTDQRPRRSNQDLIAITSRLSDAQELIARGSLQQAVDLLNETKTALWHSEHQAADPGIPFDEWLKKNNLFFADGNPK